MTQQTTQIPISLIILDEDIYPRKGIDPRRVGMFSENIRDGSKNHSSPFRENGSIAKFPKW